MSIAQRLFGETAGSVKRREEVVSDKKKKKVDDT